MLIHTRFGKQQNTTNHRKHNKLLFISFNWMWKTTNLTQLYISQVSLKKNDLKYLKIISL